jgi:hypothetical protein
LKALSDPFLLKTPKTKGVVKKSEMEMHAQFASFWGSLHFMLMGM